jgi:predicted metal-binding membrane protein
VRSYQSVAGLVSRDRTIIASCILLVSALAWVYLFHLDRQMSVDAGSDTVMARMGMTIESGWTARDFVFTFAMWAVMMVGMMAATVAPVLFLFTEMRSGRGDSHPRLSSAIFGGGHIAVWIVFSAAAALLQWVLHQGDWLSSGMTITSSRLAGIILIAAGLYQMTPAKRACLTRCQSPLGFLLSNWRDGANGALTMGIRHGAFCLGCCWAIMLVLFVVGIMNLAWVAALTAFILLEKFGPAGVRVARVAGVLVICFGMFHLFR